MTLTNPWGLLFLGLVVPVLMLHLLRSDRRRVIVPSALLWDDDPDPRTAARPWQRLRWTLPLVLQLGVVAIASTALAGPALRRDTPLAKHTVLVVDASASMGAQDGSDSGATRQDAAQAEAVSLIDAVPRGGVVTVVVAGATPRIAAARSSDRGDLRALLARVEPEAGADLRGAASLARGVIRPGEDTSIVLLNDGGWPADAVAELPPGTVERRVGEHDLNVALGALVVEDQGSSMVVRVPVAYTGKEALPGGKVSLSVAVDGRVAARRDVDVGTTAAPAEARVVVERGERVMASISPVGGGGRLDLLAADDAAFAVAERRVRQVLVVGPADPFLDPALASIDGLEVRRSLTPIDPGDADAIIYNGVSVPGDPGAPFLAIAPPGGAPGINVIGEISGPSASLVRTDLDLLRGLDLSSLIVGTAQRVLVGDAPTAATEGDLAEARRRSASAQAAVGLVRDVSVLVGDEQGPLLLSGSYAGRPFAYFTFSMRQSNLGVQVAFPLIVERLLANLGGSGRATPATEAGSRIALPGDGTSTVRSPDGRSVRVSPGDPGPTADRAGFWEIESGSGTQAVAVDVDRQESVLVSGPALAIPPREDATVAKTVGAAQSELISLRALIISALLVLLLVEGVLVARRKFVPGRARAAGLMRAVVAASCVAALLSPEVRRTVEDVGVVVIVDESASMIGEPATEAARDFAKFAVAADGRRLVVVRVADGAQLATGIVSDSTSLDVGATDLASGLRVASGALPDTLARRVVLISDGRATTGDALGVARALRDRGIGLDVVAVAPSARTDAAVVNVAVADGARVGEEIVARVRVRSTTAGPIRVIVQPSDDAAAAVSAVGNVAASGEAVIDVPVVVTEEGVSRFVARVVQRGDVQPDNDTSGFAVVARAPGRVLVVSGSPGAADYLAPALTAGGLNVSVVPPSGLATTAGLVGFDAVVLVDVSARDLTGEQTSALSAAVRDSGLGLVTIGGTRAYGFGGYLGSPLESVLPVTSDITGRNRRASVAQVLAVDTSSSMAACHCNRFDENGALTLPVRLQGGIDKTLLAKAAAARTIEALTGVDQVAVVAFTDEAQTLVPLQRVTDPGRVIQALDPIRAFGNTEIGVPLKAAGDQLRDAKADLRHIVLLTDGFAVPEDLAALEAQARKLNEEGITVSVVGVGEGSDPALERVARAGGGRFYPNGNLLDVPQVVMQEAVVASRPFLVEELSLPRVTGRAAPVRELTEAPPVRGHLATTAREKAEVWLDLPAGKIDGAVPLDDAGTAARDPLLVSWRVGLGRSTAWTSDATSRWSQSWVGWNGFVPFWTSVVTDALRPPTAGGAGVRVDMRTNELGIEVEVAAGTDPNVRAEATVISPEGDSLVVAMRRTGERTFAATVPDASALGGWVAAVNMRADDRSVVAAGTGIGVRSWPAELTPASPTERDQGRELLAALSRAAGGRGVIDPGADVFNTNGLRPGRRDVSLAPWLLALALVLWPIDIAVRRLGTGRSDGGSGPHAGSTVTRRVGWAVRRVGPKLVPRPPRWPS